LLCHLKIWKVDPKEVGSALIEVQSGLDTVLLSHHLLCNEVVIPGRIVACGREEDGWETAKSLGVGDGTEEPRGVIWFEISCVVC
jgi:hypothetical protein